MSRCQRCGTENAEGARFCISCGAEMPPATAPTAATWPTAPPSAGPQQAWDTPAQQPGTRTYAGMGERFVAVLVDGIIIGIVGGIVARVLGFPYVPTVIYWVYAIYFLGTRGATWGKQLMKIKVVKTDGSPCDYGTAALREILGKIVSFPLTLGIGYLFPLWDERKQALHDKIAGTVVIKAE